jgi:myo-inositol-1(or 4)-monophosphatase
VGGADIRAWYAAGRYAQDVPTQVLSTELAVAIEAAHEAGRIQVEHYERLERIVKKSAKDVVTEADHLCEEAIIAVVRRSFPTDAFLAEESGHSGVAGGTAPADGAGASEQVGPEHRIWVIDPLDGTVNYANGIPHFCTSIGLAIGGRPAVAVVLDPMRDDLFAAVTGQFASLNGVPVRNPSRPLGDAVVSLALPWSRFAERERRIRKAVRIDRSMGSAALGLAWVANGRFDAFIQLRGLSLWDIAAAGLIAQEAGATVTGSDGGPWFDLTRRTRSSGLVAAAPEHHAALLAMLR